MTSRTQQYLETLLWCTSDYSREDGQSFDQQGYGVNCLTKASVKLAARELRDFTDLIEREGISLDGSPWEDSEQFAHDFALSRNGHGAGFFDRGHALGDRLQELAKTFGETNIRRSGNGWLILE